jgi:NNP family nitrate/nitrite transporter-like MFS transporter
LPATPPPQGGRPAEAEPAFLPQAWPILFLVGIFLVNFMSRVGLGPLLPAVEDDLAISHAQAGSLFLFTSVGYFLALFSSGLVSSRLGHRHTIILSGLAVGAALAALAMVESFAGLAAGMALVGAAGGFYLPSGIATLTGLVRQRHWGKALAMHELAPNLGLVSAPLVAELLLGPLSWQGVLASLGLASLAITLVYAGWGRGGRFFGQAPNPANLWQLLAEPSSWLIMLMFGLGIGGSLGVYTMLPLYLVEEQGLELASANLVVSASRVAGVAVAFLAGAFSDRAGPAKALAAVFGLTGLATIALGLAPRPWLWGALFLQPTLAVCFFPAGFAALSRLVDASLRNLAVSVVIPLGFVLGSGAVPTLIGWMGETVSFAAGIVAVGCLILGGVGLAAALGRRGAGRA